MLTFFPRLVKLACVDGLISVPMACAMEHCDINHVIHCEAGAWTCLSNLQCSYRQHHNMKTDRKLHATITPNRHTTWDDTDQFMCERSMF